MHLTSPGVDRAIEFARMRAEGRAQPITLRDLILGLLADEDGRPAVILSKMGVSAHHICQKLGELPATDDLEVSSLEALFTSARDWSVAYRHDLTILTDAFFLSVIESPPQLVNSLKTLGLDPERYRSLLLPVSVSSHESEAGTAFRPPETLDTVGAGRALDANFNRAREALRTIEDHCRFVLDDRFLTGQVKDLRHELAAISSRLPAHLLLRSRDTRHDLGTSIETMGEYERTSSEQITLINLKRLQEALRSLEEFSKLFDSSLARELEQCRYRCYTLERSLTIGVESRALLGGVIVYVLVSGAQCVGSLQWTIEEAAAGGATAFQLREKTLPDHELIARARDIRRWTERAKALFIVNDRPDIARLSRADGVHLGQEDLSVKDARRILGPGGIIGVSTHTIEQVREAVFDGADYIGIGPAFPSTTKSFPHLAGVDFLRSAVAETALPAFALGGISPQNIAKVVVAGVRRVAVSSSVVQSDDPRQAAMLLREHLLAYQSEALNA